MMYRCSLVKTASLCLVWIMQCPVLYYNFILLRIKHNMINGGKSHESNVIDASCLKECMWHADSLEEIVRSVHCQVLSSFCL